MSKENVHSVMDSPRFEPWTTEEWLDDKGKLQFRDLYMAPVRLKRGALTQFVDEFRQRAATGQSYFLEFYSPAGMLMNAEVRAIAPQEGDEIFDIVDFLVALSPNQLLALFPGPEDFGAFGY